MNAYRTWMQNEAEQLRGWLNSSRRGYTPHEVIIAVNERIQSIECQLELSDEQKNLVQEVAPLLKHFSPFTTPDGTTLLIDYEDPTWGVRVERVGAAGDYESVVLGFTRQRRVSNVG